jgi:hypothetical protein
MQEKQHSLLSPSSYERWGKCTASVKFIESLGIENNSNIYSEEGTLAHAIASYILIEKHVIGKAVSSDDLVGKTLLEFKALCKEELNLIFFSDDYVITLEMIDFVDEYISYVESFKEPNSSIFIETRVDFSKLLDVKNDNGEAEGFGTLDAAIIRTISESNIEFTELHLFDLKYGKGVIVSADKNSQMMLYALGLLLDLNVYKTGVDRIFLHIVQPRVFNFSTYALGIEELFNFAEEAKLAAREVFSDNPKFRPGKKQCRWCPGKEVCTNKDNPAFTDFFDDLDD